MFGKGMGNMDWHDEKSSKMQADMKKCKKS